MSATGLYALVDDAKNLLGLPSSDHRDDAWLGMTLESVSRLIELYTGRRFWSATETRYYTAHCASSLYTDDILAITSLRTDEDGNASYETTWATGDYYLAPFNATLHPQPEPYTQIITRPNSSVLFPVGITRGVQIAGTFGFNPTTAMPMLVKTAVLQQVMLDFRAKDAPMGSVGGGESAQPQRMPGGLHPFTARSLDYYRRRVHGG